MIDLEKRVKVVLIRGRKGWAGERRQLEEKGKKRERIDSRERGKLSASTEISLAFALGLQSTSQGQNVC